MKHVPNILTGIRLVLSLVVFLCLTTSGGGMPFVGHVYPGLGGTLLLIALFAFVVAAVTDFFDGWLARKYDVVSVTGAILDPIGDKVLVCGALLGLVCLGAIEITIPAGLILFREFSVSALREVLAPRGLKLPVTFLAKTKTTVQLVAITVILAVPLVGAWLRSTGHFENGGEVVRKMMLGGFTLLWLAAFITVWTGIEYAIAARKALTNPPAELA
jgi:CDP-diacylglycerol--glycerol-3-phosphate 3-phosphatidyltransferase